MLALAKAGAEVKAAIASLIARCAVLWYNCKDMKRGT